MTDEIQKLKRDIALNQVVIFIGSGVSTYTTDGESVSHWKGLLKHGLHRCYQSRWINDEDFAYFMEKFENNTAEMNDYLLAANQIKDCFRRKSTTRGVDIYKSWLLEMQRKLVAKKPELIKVLGEFECPVVTTNYDTLLETILNKRTLLWNDCSTENLSDELKGGILHLYGCYNETESVVFSGNDYKRFYKNHSQRSKLRRLIEGKSILLIGYDGGISNPTYSNLLKWLSDVKDELSIYKLINSTKLSDLSFFDNIKEIPYGNNSEDFFLFLKNLGSFTSLFRENLLSQNRKENLIRKYLTNLIAEYGYVSIFGSANENEKIPLEKVYVELKFDPTHPSIKAMKTLEINEEFKRKLLSRGFFNEKQRNQLKRAILEKNISNSERIYEDLMIDQWLNILLNNKKIFNENDSQIIRDQINQLKRNILEKNSFQEKKEYSIDEALNQFEHMIILGHPGSGKTTLSKWLIINLAKEYLNKSQGKIPILIPIWKYVEYQSKENINLLDFISKYLNEGKEDLSNLLMNQLIEGNLLIIFEGLDEIPNNINRLDLIKQINCLIEKQLDFDLKLNKLIYSIYSQKQSNGNRFIITSRIEGNYFEDIHFNIPRLTIENMSNESLKLFCYSYTQSNHLYEQICQNKNLFQLAINPQLASVIVTIYQQYQDQLPNKRIDLYQKAIEISIQRLTNHLKIDQIILWNIMEEIAFDLHSKVEGLCEDVLREIIEKYLSESDLSVILTLVNLFKYQSGLLCEFGQDSFRFLHRTFQEYLAAKFLLYSNGIQRSEELIYENILNKINIPNWRVPLSMTFGLLSEHNHLFTNIIQRLLTNDQTSSSNTLLVPFVIIDSLNDIHFSSKTMEDELIRKLVEMLLIDYKNRSGFSRLKEHQNLIHSYFSKLETIYSNILREWFIEKLNDEENIAACANIIYQLKWYDPNFHQIFLNNLHNDSNIWNWPVDSLLRFYSREIGENTGSTPLIFKNAMIHNPKIVEHILKNSDWLRLIVAVYGGYHNYHTPSSISEYYEIAHFLELNDNERAPFLLYYQDIWGREDPSYKMAVYLDTFKGKEDWNRRPDI